MQASTQTFVLRLVALVGALALLFTGNELPPELLSLGVGGVAFAAGVSTRRPGDVPADDAAELLARQLEADGGTTSALDE